MMKNNKEHGNNTQDFNIRISFFIIFKNFVKSYYENLKKTSRKKIYKPLSQPSNQKCLYLFNKDSSVK